MSKQNFSRRDMLKLFGVGGAATVVGGKAAALCATGETPFQVHQVEAFACGQPEVYPASPFILNPYTDPLPVPKALRPGWRRGPFNSATDAAWTVRQSQFGTNTVVAPGPEAGHQDAIGDRPVLHDGEIDEFGNVINLPHAGTHQLFPNGAGSAPDYMNATEKAAFEALAAPMLYHIRVGVSTHKFTTSPVVPIDKQGVEVTLPAGANAPRAFGINRYFTPATTMYTFNGTFPGPMINCEYGKPVIVRFENDLDFNPNCLDRQNFGAPDFAFLTHLHNGHTAPESDGNPHHMTANEGGYQPGQWSDNMYLGYPAGGLDTEKQSFLWFHDHRMHHTGPNVYKGMVGLMPHYDPGVDDGDERRGLRLPGVRTNNADGTFDVNFDIPLAFYDCALDDGRTIGSDMHTPTAAEAAALPGWNPGNICGQTHPQWWGKLFLRHYPNHGFVGDIFTVNCVAYPVLNVRRRKYRFRFLGASLARVYDLSFRKGTPMPFPGSQGQWNFGRRVRAGFFGQPTVVRDAGQQVFRMTQIASEGGLLPVAVMRDKIEVWPAKRSEVIIDFTRYMDGTPTRAGDVVYLTNTMEMPDGRKPILAGDPATINVAVPLLKFVIGTAAVDNSVMPQAGITPLRASPFVDRAAVPARSFTLSRGGGAAGPETEWLINGNEFIPEVPLAFPKRGSFETWALINGGGGWTHPMHIHQEEHHAIRRNDVPVAAYTDPTNPAFDVRHSDDLGKADLAHLDPGEEVHLYRGFRTYAGNYVAHCHNLAHEDHNMMFGWTIIP